LVSDDIALDWEKFCDTLTPIWAQSRLINKTAQWAGSHRVADWTRHLMTRAALSGAGHSARSLERRMKRWTGQSKQSLHAYAQLEELLNLRVNEPDAPLASIAADAQFSDQFHMGRTVKKATGFPPGRLNQLIETDKAFWCYRLLGDRP
jgi:AraC-like DNA-binding protein